MADLEKILTEDAQAEKEQSAPVSFATIGAVYQDGVSLIFDGTEDESEKHYKCNTSVFFRAGDRVKLAADSGTYVAEYVVGTPMQPSQEVHGIPAGGSINQVLRKTTGADYAAGWSNVAEVPSGGSTNQVLTKTASSYGWANVPTPAVTVDKLTSGYYTVGLSGTTFYGAGISLGSAYNRLSGLYISGSADISGAFGCNGATPQGKQYLSSSATVSDVIAVLRKFGFVS